MITKEQKRDWHREWRKRNPEKEKEYAKKAYWNHKEECLERARKRHAEHPEIRKAYYMKNKERIKEKSHRYFITHKHEANARNRNWRKNNLKRAKQRQREYRLKNLEKAKMWALKSRYGMTMNEYNEILKQQNGKCAICGSNKPKYIGHNKLYVDHNHKTNENRGLLCKTCNLMLGNAEENIEILKNGIEYLNKYNKIALLVTETISER